MTFTQKSRQLLKSSQLLKRLFLGRFFWVVFQAFETQLLFFGCCFVACLLFWGKINPPPVTKPIKPRSQRPKELFPTDLQLVGIVQGYKVKGVPRKTLVVSFCPFVWGRKSNHFPWGGGIVNGWVQAALIVNLLGKSSTSFFNIRFFMRDLVSFKYECLNLWMNLHHLNKL